MELNFSKCTLASSIALDEQDKLDDSQNGQYGYRVFYTVPIEELSKFFNARPVGAVSGELEFTVDADGKQYGEVLLWTTIEDDDGSLTNDDFIPYNEDISEFVKSFNSVLPANVWVAVEDLYGEQNPQENQLCLGETESGKLWLYKFSWWDDVCGGFYRMIDETENERDFEESLVKIMPLNAFLKEVD